MILKGCKLRNSINGLNATVEDITRNGVFILNAETVHLGFSNTCKKPFIRTERMSIDSKLLHKYIDMGTWKVID